MASLQTKAESVKSALLSTSSCTTTTVSLLNELLSIKSDEQDSGKGPVINRGTQGGLSAKSRTTKGPKSGTAAARRGGKSCGDELSPKEKATLATEVINATLKTLNVNGKPTPPVRQSVSTSDVRDSPRRKALRRSTSVPHSPPEPRSLNRVSSSPNIGARSSRSLSSASVNSSGCRAIAECARIAFSCLRGLQLSRTPCMMDMAPLQLEHGMSAFIGKLVALGIDDLALKELKILKKRVNGTGKALNKQASNKNGGAGAIQASNTTNMSENFAELLDFEVPPAGGAALLLAITTQLQTLKTLTSSKKPDLITAILPNLHPDHQSSPIQLLLQSAKESPNSATKAARQLEMLSQLILSLCPSISSSDDTMAINSKLSPPPEVALQLQTIAFQYRVLWWKLCDHQGDTENDVLVPFSRCLAAFTRRSQLSSLETYHSASNAFQVIRELSKSDFSFGMKKAEYSLQSISKLLGSLAQDAGRLEEAVVWLKKVEEAFCGAPVSEVQGCALAASLVALKLVIPGSDAECEDLLLSVIEGLERPLKGETRELDELLSEVSKARRAAVTRLYKQRPGSGDNSTAMSNGLRQMCESLILQCPRFSIRYLGKPPDTSSAPKVIVRYEQRRQFIGKSGFHTVDSSMFLLKQYQSQGRLTWEIMDATLRDCLHLLEYIDIDNQDSINDCVAAARSYFVKMSQLYFTQHLNMRRDAEGPKDIQYVRPLRRSIECIISRSIHEKKAALVNMKLERLADICKTIGRYDESRDSLVTLQNELFGSDILSRVAKLGATTPLREAWNESEDASMLARTFSSLLKFGMKSGSRLLRIPLYDVAWSPQEKGVVLEHLLDILIKQQKESPTVQREIILELFTVYEPRRFPIRRLRIVAQLLKMDPEQQREFSEDVQSTLAFSKVTTVIENSEDIGLISYLAHYEALVSTAMELQEVHPRVDLLRPHLAFWGSILENAQDYEALTRLIDDVPNFPNHLLSIADFLHMKGFGMMRVPVLRMITCLNEIPRPDSSPDDLVLSHISLALQYLELGYSGKAGLSLDRAQLHASCNGVTPQALMQVQLSYAEYLLTIGSPDKCEEALSKAQTLAVQHPDLYNLAKAAGNIQCRTFMTGLAAYAFLIHSLLALARGATGAALVHAKRSVKLIRYNWVKVAMHMKSKRVPQGAANVDSVTEDISCLSLLTSISTITCSPCEQLPGPSAWALVGQLFKSLSHLSALYAHNGMFQETIYYAEQAHKLVQLVDSGAHLMTALVATGNTWLSAGKLDQASEFFVKAKTLSSTTEISRTGIVLNYQFGRLHGLLDNQEASLTAYSDAFAKLETLSSVKHIHDIDHIKDHSVILEEEMSKLNLKKGKPIRSGKTTVSKKAPKKSATISKHAAELPVSISEESVQFSSLKGFLLRQKADTFVLWKQCEEATVLLKDADAYLCKEGDKIDQQLVTAKQLLLQSLEQMSADPVYSVLQDSTISFPAILPSSRTAAPLPEKPLGTRFSPRKNQSVSSMRGHHRPRSPSSIHFFDKLRLAQERLNEAISTATLLSSTTIIHKLTSLLCAVTILLSASSGKTSIQPSFGIFSMEISRNVGIQRERRAILHEQVSSDPMHEEMLWPEVVLTDNNQLKNELTSDAIQFQKEYIDIIPQGWTAISISLSESRQDLCITKMQSGHSPFILRLPLGRNNSRDVDEEVFDYDQGKTELLEIIELANKNSHTAKELNGRGAKTAWWAEREALDVRLRDLLENIETVWLGGFRGIFSQHRPRPDMLARFQKSFTNILDKHLPSRQNAIKKGTPARVALDTQVLELFIGLEEASNEDCNLDEALTDLLYFVIDILQFHGERNAYDEIDFDSIVIETHDALRSYQEAMLAASTSNEDKHTILILDKALHAFPWESLPCMDGLAVSRLPSLGCLRERIIEQNSISSTCSKCHFVDSMNGGYVLNPGGDLKTTQSTFENDLLAMNTWTGIIEREPTETEMRENLGSKDIFLYFGHGSGAQYIRSKAIKKLKKCAVTMLMGCSSGALTEVGEFEPYGPPIDYMLAGCPALVATLWDVTDKDIDRFAKSAFEHWGLFKSQLAHTDSTSRGKGKKTMDQSPNCGEQKSLVKAVAEGRRACHFRYLTAASICVYGIPVYLK